MFSPKDGVDILIYDLNIPENMTKYYQMCTQLEVRISSG